MNFEPMSKTAGGKSLRIYHARADVAGAATLISMKPKKSSAAPGAVARSFLTALKKRFSTDKIKHILVFYHFASHKSKLTFAQYSLVNGRVRSVYKKLKFAHVHLTRAVNAWSKGHGLSVLHAALKAKK
jgi:hypothetical protein